MLWVQLKKEGTLSEIYFENCPIRNSGFCKFLKRNGSVRDFPSAGIRECEACQIVRHDSDLSNLINYKDSSMHQWAAGHSELTEQQNEDTFRRIQEVKRIVIENEFKKLLDVGCATGIMVAAFNEFCHAEGVEPETRARNIALEKGLKIYTSILDAKKNGKSFDVVTLFHVIEHIDNSYQFIQDIRELMNKNGILIVETPNSMDALLTIYENESFQNFTYWSHHPILYSKFALTNLLEISGFEILDSKGVQRYSLDNHLFWLSKGKPGGHKHMKDLVSMETKNSYNSDLISKDINDTLWIICKKK